MKSRPVGDGKQKDGGLLAALSRACFACGGNSSARCLPLVTASGSLFAVTGRGKSIYGRVSESHRRTGMLAKQSLGNSQEEAACAGERISSDRGVAHEVSVGATL